MLSDLYRADRPGWRFALARRLELQAIKHAKLVLAISECTARDVERLLHIPAERIAVTHLGIDQRFHAAADSNIDREELCRRYALPADRKIVLYVGGIDQRKNMKGLLETFARVVRSRRDRSQELPVLVMAGAIEEDAEYPKLMRSIETLELQELVCMTGFVAEDDLPAFYKLGSVLFFPSLYEGFGLTPLEAMAVGTPVVSSNAACLPDVLGDAAALVAPDDYEGSASEIVSVLENDSYAEELIQKGRQQAAKFCWSDTGAATLAAYQRLAVK